MADRGSEQEVWAIAQEQRIAILTTVEKDGKPVSRPMASLVRPEDHAIYFVTRTDSEVGKLGGSAPVNIAYADTHKNTYLSISGTARTSQDREKLHELWSMFTEAWLPQGPDADDVALITVEPEEAKIWDSTSSILIYAGKVLKAVATQSPPNGGRIEEVDMSGGAAHAGAGPVDTSGFEAYDKGQRARNADFGAARLGGPAN